MKLHRVSPFIFIVPLLFCSPLRAQTDQPFSVQLSGVALWAPNRGTTGTWDLGVEGQIRWTRGAWSLGAGLQSTSSEKKGEDFTFESDVSTLGFFLEPRFVVGILGRRMGLYLLGRMTVARISENEFGTFIDGGLGPVGEAYSVEGIRNSLAAHVGPGLLIRLTSRLNLDVGVTAGFTHWGEADTTGVPPYDFWSSSRGYWDLGGSVGLVIGIG